MDLLQDSAKNRNCGALLPVPHDFMVFSLTMEQLYFLICKFLLFYHDINCPLEELEIRPLLIPVDFYIF
jgi:hypothetical protein